MGREKRWGELNLGSAWGGVWKQVWDLAVSKRACALMCVSGDVCVPVRVSGDVCVLTRVNVQD